MFKTKRHYLDIFIVDLNNDQNDLFKCISSINNQIGFDLKNNVLITLLTDRSISDLNFELTYFNKLNINFIQIENYDLIYHLNNNLDNSNAQWVTFINSKDLLFSDGSLLDFIVYSRKQIEKDIIVFNFVSSIKDEKGEIIDFSSNNYLNFIFGKYFKVSYLKDNEIYFNDKLNKYLTEDYSSKAIELSKKNIWFDLNNYYLKSLPKRKEDFTEFCTYRKDFILFMKKHSRDYHQVLNDICWSIVTAFYMINHDGLNKRNKTMLLELFNLLRGYENYRTILKKQFNDENDYNEFNKFMEG